MIIALAGNPNCGKTTLFNALTGSDARTGNFPGVTVEQREGALRGYDGVTLVDLPGTYSLRPVSEEEAAAGGYLAAGEADAVLCVADATCPTRALYLAMQLRDAGMAVVVAMNMTDELRRGGGEIDCPALSRRLGVLCLPVSALTGEGIAAAAAAAVNAATAANRSTEISIREPTERSIMALYRRIDRACAGVVRLPGGDSPAFSRTRRLDRVLTGRHTAYASFALAMCAVFALTFGAVGRGLSELVSFIFGAAGRAAGDALAALGVPAWLGSFVCGGVIGALGSVCSFLPYIIILFLLLSLLEDSGYMARAAFIMDAPMRRFGLSGRSVAALMLGFGCTVPAAMATRILPSGPLRRRTLRILPLMSCPAKIPVYAVFCAAYFPRGAALVMAGLYALGIILALAASGAGKSIACARCGRCGGEDPAQQLELPPYRLPDARTTWRLLRSKVSEFMVKAFAVVLPAAVVMWLLGSLDLSLNFTADRSRSLLAAAGRALEGLMSPAGLGDWRLTASLIAGLTAKEAVVGSLAALCGSGLPLAQALRNFVTLPSAVSFMLFTLLYTPCAAAFAVMRRELGGTLRALTVSFGQLAVAWLVSTAAYQLLRLFFR